MIYISGKKGFIGSHLANQFRGQGHEVISEEFRLKDIESLLDIKPEVIIHCAARVGSKSCEDDRDRAFEDNVEGTYRIVEVARKLKSYFIYVSSIAVYDFCKGRNYITENTPVKPFTWYGRTKYLGEIIASEIDPLILRLGFVYGLPEEDKHSLISSLMQGINIPLVGNYSKDYIYIDDCVGDMV